MDRSLAVVIVASVYLSLAESVAAILTEVGAARGRIVPSA